MCNLICNLSKVNKTTYLIGNQENLHVAILTAYKQLRKCEIILYYTIREDLQP